MIELEGMPSIELIKDRFTLRLDIAAARLLVAVDVVSIEESLELE